MKRVGYSGSEHFSLSKDDWKKIGKGAAIAAIAGACTWLLDVAFPSLQERPGLNMTLYTLAAVILNVIRKWATDTTITVIAWIVVISLMLPAGEAVAETPIQKLDKPKQILLLRPALIGQRRLKGRLIPVKEVGPNVYLGPRPTFHHILDPLGLLR